MLAKWLFPLFLILLYGCQEYSTFEKRGDKAALVTPNQAGISEVQLVKWHVGPPLSKQTITKGIRFEVTFPMLEKDHLQYLVDHLKVDSWLVRLNKRTLTRAARLKPLYYIPLIVPQPRSVGSTLRIRQLEKGFFKVFYKAAAFSPRFAAIRCPQFGHRKVILDFQEVASSGRMKALKISRGNKKRVYEKVEKFSYEPKIVDGGRSLLGKFDVEIAFYDSATKTRLSNFASLSDTIKVTKERDGIIKGCNNYKMQDSIDNEKMRQFNFGK
ncbi:MAG: hypothetical protein HN509_13275 [Halobacteriovoraceae bacterium]|jgi:hypothetical protein|nr:hypothetical protein [Halobacteriovoraceae bacterium]MBT5094402.1 hypothetical protein [Halobacteriovoraceae bacterium]